MEYENIEIHEATLFNFDKVLKGLQNNNLSLNDIVNFVDYSYGVVLSRKNKHSNNMTVKEVLIYAYDKYNTPSAEVLERIFAKKVFEAMKKRNINLPLLNI